MITFAGAGLPPRVSVWTAEADSGPSDDGALLDLLDGQEKATALRRPDHKRAAYVLAHALRRLLLASCLGAEPGEVVFTAGLSGYPDPVPDGTDWWYHSLSHSARFVAVAAAPNIRLGVDIEGPRALRHAGELARMLLAPDGGNGGRAAPQPPPHADVLAAWVRWEALAKATGEGLLRRLHPVPDRLSCAGREWRVHSLPHDRAHLALALAE